MEQKVNPADKVERWKIERLVPYARNARTHSDEQVAQIAASIREWGWTTPVLVDEDGGIIAGHGRTLAAQRLQMTEVPVMVAKGWSDAKKRAYILADNKLALNAGWENELLNLELSELKELDFDLELIGFSADEIAALMPLELEPGLTDEDAVPEVPAVPVTVLGDVWVLGRHRVMCGDSTSIDAVEKLMAGKTADFCFTSPPYNAGDSEKLSGNTHTTDNKYGSYRDNKPSEEYLTLLTDFTSTWLTYSKTVCVNIQQLAGNKTSFIEWLAQFKRNFVDMGVWDKGHAAPQMARNVMANRFEYLVFLAPATDPSRAIPCADFQGTVQNVYQASPQRNNEFSKVHAATFPIHLPEWAIETFTKKGVVVSDAFGGTGTTLIACEKTGRINRSMELDPKYVDVIIKRWQDFTGKIAVHAETNQPFAEVKNGK